MIRKRFIGTQNTAINYGTTYDRKFLGKRIADGREGEPQEVPGGAAGIMPQQVYGQRENCEEYPPEDETLGVVSEDGLTAVVESFCNEGKAFASGHFFVLFHNKN